MKTKSTFQLVLAAVTILLVAGSLVLRHPRQEKPKDPSYADLRSAFETFWIKAGMNTDEDDKPLKLADPVEFEDLHASCQDHKLFALSMMGVNAIDSSGEKVNLAGPWTGSGGTHVMVLGWDAATASFTKLFGDNLLDLYPDRVAKNQSCPPIPALVHGSYFNRVGYDSGEINLVFNLKTKKYVMAH